MNLTATLRAEYCKLYSTCEIRPDWKARVKASADTLMKGRTRYASVAAKMQNGMPWFVVGLVHAMECDFSFSRHLHNGDPLTARTVNVPKGRPTTGKPPFTWETSAEDALRWEGTAARTDWSLPSVLHFLEGYNGWGYRKYHPDVLSPYLWSGSQHYKAGKYAADGKWSQTLVSRQVGAAVLLKELIDTKRV